MRGEAKRQSKRKVENKKKKNCKRNQRTYVDQKKKKKIKRRKLMNFLQRNILKRYYENSGIKEKKFCFSRSFLHSVRGFEFFFFFFFSKTLNVTHRILTRYEIARAQKKSLRNRSFKGELNDTYPKNNYFFHCPWTFSGRWRHENKIIHALALPSSSNHETRLHIPRNTMTEFQRGRVSFQRVDRLKQVKSTKYIWKDEGSFVQRTISR